MTLDILIARLNMTDFVKIYVSKYDRADYTKRTKSVIIFHPE